MTSQPGTQRIAIHILPNISRSTGNQTMKFGQLTEYKMRNFFLEKSFIKSGGETITRLFSKNQNRAYLWTNSLKLYTVCFSLIYISS